MRRVILAGVGLTLTACGFSATPTSQPTASKPAAQPDSYVSAMADTEQCTLWREVAGQRQCLDGAQAAARAPVAPLKAPAPSAAPRLAVTSQPLEAPATAAAAPTPHPADAALADLKPTGPNLFEEMRKLGMIKPGSGETTAPGFVAVAPATAPGSSAPALPSLPTAGQPMLAATTPPVSNVSAFADTAPKPGPVPARPAAPAVASVVTQSWAPVEPPKAQEPRVQLAASTPGVGELQERSPVTAAHTAPVTPVEKAALPPVRSSTVVPLKITQKATDDTAAVVEPAMAAPAAPVASRQLAQASAPALPSLPALPPLPSASSAPVTSAPVASAPVSPVTPATVSKPVALAAPVLPSAPMSAPAPVASSKPASANPLPSVPPASTGWSTTAKITPAQAPAKVVHVSAPAREVAAKAVPVKTAKAPAAGKYLVLQSFQERERADRLASRYRGMDAQVASVSIKGQTWHRVVVRDGASARRQLASDGVRGFWPTSL